MERRGSNRTVPRPRTRLQRVPPSARPTPIWVRSTRTAGPSRRWRAASGWPSVVSRLGRLPGHASGGEVPDVTVVFTVDAIRFVNDHEAVVTYSAHITGSLNITLGDRPGRALLVDGEWKVTRETFCEWMRVGGVECPPRKKH